MRYFLDTEFIEDGKTIDLISIGIVCDETGDVYYAQNIECDFAKANDWVKENVIPHLKDWQQYEGRRSSYWTTYWADVLNGFRLSPWKPRRMIKEDIIKLLGQEPEIWGYFADYDWVVFCQLFGRMIDLPESYPKFCWDIKQEAEKYIISGESLHKACDLPEDVEHNALADSLWNRRAFHFIERIVNGS